MYDLTAGDLLDVVGSMYLDEIAEMRLLTTLTATAGSKVVVVPTRQFLAQVEATTLRDARAADGEEAARSALAAEAAIGGPS